MKTSKTLLGLISIFFISSCQKVININLNSSSPKYIIEGNIYDHAGPYNVKISRSINFNQENIFPPDSTANVIITDITANQVDTLIQTTPGNYQTNFIIGAIGHTYQLYIKTGNNVFTANTTMPALVKMDSLYDKKSLFGKSFSMVPVYREPVNKGNYFHFIEYVNDTLSGAVYVRNDNFIASGQVIQQPLQGGGSNGKTINEGDFVEVYMECIDSSVYQYFYTLNQTSNQNSATPANPASNIKGGALGYFSAQTSHYLSVDVY